MIKETVLTTGDKALGLGDAFILAPTLVGLAKKYNVRHIATNQSHKILKHIGNNNGLKIFDMNSQGHFYDNDAREVFNLVYWDYHNKLRGFNCHALNACRQIAKLEPFNDVLPEIPIPEDIDKKTKEFIDGLEKPVVVIAPLMSYWNKMIPNVKQVAIVDAMIKKGYSVIQLTGSIPNDFLHPGALSLVGKTSLEQSMSMVKHADLFVGLDSFLQHCSANVKTPAVVMWCGTSPEDFGYPFFSNISHPEIAFCQDGKCGRPARWIFDYTYKDKNNWNSRDEAGWICPSKLCSEAITVDEVIAATEKELKIGKDRDWTFYNYKYDWKNKGIKND